jgi:hypothetical protein
VPGRTLPFLTVFLSGKQNASKIEASRVLHSLDSNQEPIG